ncbi:HlyD family secretion protein [Paludibaculum fermentans]|uniref:HlyD family secretion protein n=1 Tax=Paludibaculum fermentans TaxID=1473598 RepID=UPI003EBDD4DE
MSSLAAMELVTTPRIVRTLAAILVVMFLFTALALVFTPWQQSVSGLGQVSAFSPLERTQVLSAPVEGRVLRWHVSEGSRVKKGAVIVELADNDKQMLDRIRNERSAVDDRRGNAEGRVSAHLLRIGRLEESRTSAISAAQNRVTMAEERIGQARQALTMAQERLTAARLNLDRHTGLLKSGLASQRSLELARQESATAQAEVLRAEAALSAAQSEKRALDDDLRKVRADGDAAIEAERASIQLARGEVANIRAELQRIDVRVARQQTQTLVAPRDGTVLRLLAQPESVVFKAGEPLAQFVPDVEEPTVELWLSGVDLPLVQPGDAVRLQFNGWPAIQFVGWPSVAVGTFGGRVRLVDATGNKAGKFRILVSPDPADERWPSANYLRQGVQAKGWVLLRQVPLGWEFWRRLNGFPPVIAENEPGAATSESKEKKP